MTAENAYKLYHAVKLFYQGKYDPKKYNWSLPTLPPFDKQRDRHFFSRIAQKLNTAEIHGLYTVGFFHKVNAYVADLVTPDWMMSATRFVARGQNGRAQLESDLYDLSKKLEHVDLDAWLYGDVIDGQRTLIPGCLQMVSDGELDIDVAALVLLIPQPHLSYDWSGEMQRRPMHLSFGPISLPRKLQTADRLINYNRPGWRLLSQSVAADFWKATGIESLAPAAIETKPSLFLER
jgi:hypothetical protein